MFIVKPDNIQFTRFEDAMAYVGEHVTEKWFKFDTATRWIFADGYTIEEIDEH
jgi:hypothetical protein